jgi:hypothetical protein
MKRLLAIAGAQTHSVARIRGMAQLHFFVAASLRLKMKLEMRCEFGKRDIDFSAKVRR